MHREGTGRSTQAVARRTRAGRARRALRHGRGGGARDGAGLARSAIARLRCAYFAEAAEPAARYGITFDRVVLHLWDARRAGAGRLDLDAVLYLEDLVHAIACIDHNPRAWTDLTERYERALVRRSRASRDEIAATVQVRRLLAEVRRRTSDHAAVHVQDADARDNGSLRCYIATGPLRNWLAERLTLPEVSFWDVEPSHVAMPAPAGS